MTETIEESQKCLLGSQIKEAGGSFSYKHFNNLAFFFSNQKSRPLQATKKNGCCIHCTFSTLKLQSLKNYLPSSTFKVTYKTAFSLETKLNVDHQRHCACSDRKQQVRARCNHWKRVNLDQHWHWLWLRDSHRHARNPLHHETHDR